MLPTRMNSIYGSSKQQVYQSSQILYFTYQTNAARTISIAACKPAGFLPPAVAKKG